MTISIPPIVWVPVLFFLLGFILRPFYEHSIIQEYFDLFASYICADPKFEEKKKAFLNKKKAA
ncbi:hypothetical protein [Companilactobacillus muriivasis]|uniref:hypothetical protein n=1 Tax=Companilactobacillus muriivasis TaxID=3081444 RepID=UPI0030C6D542